ncbi:MAG: MATE family efflux transporter [Bacteroidales bacterium]|nr:MATE family efflux transporter [Bacteroidales bacterium]
MRKEINAIAFPAIITNVTTPLLGLVDVAVTGHIGSALYIGAIAIGGTMFNMLYWLFGFLRMGSSGLTAQAYGASDRKSIDIILCRAMLIALAGGTILIALSGVLGGLILRFMDADDATQSLAREYFSICIWGAPAVLGTFALSGWFLGLQDSRAPMWVAIATNTINIAVSLVLVFGFKLKLVGVATGTLSAQWAGFIIGFVIMMKKYRPALPSLREVVEKSELLKFFRINSDIFLRTLCLVAVTLWFTHAGALQSTEILAANALLLQLFMLFSYFMDGFAFAGEALAGKYLGQDNTASLHRLEMMLLRIGTTFALLFATVYWLGGEWFLDLLAEDKVVVATAATYLVWAIAMPVCGFGAFIYDGIFIGLTRTRGLLSSIAVAMVIFFALYFILKDKWANNALWLAFNAYLLARGVVELFILHRVIFPKMNRQ